MFEALSKKIFIYIYGAQHTKHNINTANYSMQLLKKAQLIVILNKY
jgi:hypothetical protein